MSKRTNRGFTIVELLVVISIIGMLMALLLPAVQSAREKARRMQCITKMRELAHAHIDYESTKGYYAGYRNPITTRPGLPAPWFIAISAQYGEQALHDDWYLAAGALSVPHVAGLVCPSSDHDREGPDLNYVVNAGFYPKVGTDPSPYGDRANAPAGVSAYWQNAQTKANGIFHDRFQYPNSKVTLTDLRDGNSSTLLMSENIHTVRWNDINTMTLGSSSFNAAQFAHNKISTTFVWHYASEPAGVAGALQVSPEMKVNGRPANTRFDQMTLTEITARPSSYHPGGAIVAFADKRTQFLSQDIEYRVLQQLMTPDGAQSDMPDKRLLSGSDYE